MVGVPEEEPFNLPQPLNDSILALAAIVASFWGAAVDGGDCWGPAPVTLVWRVWGSTTPCRWWLVLLVLVVVGLLGNWSFLRSRGPQQLLSRPFGNTWKRFGRERKPWQWWCDGEYTWGNFINTKTKVIGAKCWILRNVIWSNDSAQPRPRWERVGLQTRGRKNYRSRENRRHNIIGTGWDSFNSCFFLLPSWRLAEDCVRWQ